MCWTSSQHSRSEVVGINIPLNIFLFCVYFLLSSNEFKKSLGEIQELLDRIDYITFIAIIGIMTIQAIGYQESIRWYGDEIFKVFAKEYPGILLGYFSGLIVWNYYGGINFGRKS